MSKKRPSCIALAVIVVSRIFLFANEMGSEDPEAPYSRAENLAHRFFLLESAELYRKCIESDYKEFRYHLGLIDAYSAMNKISEIIPYYSERALADRSDYVSRLGMAFCNQYERNIEIARRYAEGAKELEPENPYVHFCLALISRSAGEKASVTEEHYQNAFLLDANFARAYRSYIYWHWVIKHSSRKKVLKIIDRALLISTPDPMFYYWKNEVIKEDLKYNFSDGIRLLKQALSMDNSLVVVELQIGALYSALGESSLEESAYRNVIRKAPNCIEGYMRLAEYLKKWHRYEEAIEVLERSREVSFQEVQKHVSELHICENLYYAGHWQECADGLQQIIIKYPGSSIARQARSLLSAIISRAPSDEVVIIDNVPYVAQRGNWCGPAALSMLLGYWGQGQSQENIAGEIYTGIAGTAPQIIEDYCRAKDFAVRTFEGSIKKWKNLVDQDIPCLWLHMFRRGGGHYILVTGYDDIKKEVIAHNPWYPREITISYKDLEDRWILPSLQRTIAIVPNEIVDSYDLSGLEPSFRLSIINFVLYIASGSNVYRGIFPQIFVNLVFAAVLMLILGILLYLLIFPRRVGWILAYAFLNFSFIVLCNSAIYNLRSGFFVSLLLGYHISIITLIVIMFAAWIFSFLVQDYFTRREFLGLALISFIVFAIPAVLEKEKWEILLPIAVLILALAVSFYKRIQLLRAAARLRRGYFDKAVKVFERLGSLRLSSDPFFAAIFLEIQARIELCQFKAALNLIDSLLQRKPLTKYRRRLLLLFRAEAKMFANAAEEAQSVYDSLALLQGDVLINAYANCLVAHAALSKRDCALALEKAESANVELSKKSLRMLIAGIFEFLRCQRSLKWHFQLLNFATLINAYRCLGRDKEAAQIIHEHPHLQNMEFRLKAKIINKV